MQFTLNSLLDFGTQNCKSYVDDLSSMLACDYKTSLSICTYQPLIPDFVPNIFYINIWADTRATYNIINWISAPTSNLECLKVSTKKAVRTILSKHKREHALALSKNWIYFL